MKITTIGLDLAKNVFQVHAVDERGKTVLKKQLSRQRMATFFANLPPCLVGMEACSSAHFWARKLQAFGHTVRLMAPQYVKPYVKTNKHDAADAEAICEAVTRPTMRFVPVKTVEQQTVLSLHRVRASLVKARTAQGNQIRGLLAEFGLVIAKGVGKIFVQVPALLEDAQNELPGEFRTLMASLLEHLKVLDRQAKAITKQILAWHRHNEQSRCVGDIDGFGPLISSAFVATVGDAAIFHKGRQVGAWVGLTPKQQSSGGKTVLQGISKRGDRYLRTLLIHGARSVVAAHQRRSKTKPQTALSRWLQGMLSRRHPNVVVVALANKMARVAWALLAHGRTYRVDQAADAALTH